MNILAFTPLYDPLSALFPNMSEHWLWLVVPLVVAISVVYKGTRVTSMRTLPKEATVMTLQIIVVMMFAAAILAIGYWTYIHVAAPMVH